MSTEENKKRKSPLEYCPHCKNQLIDFEAISGDTVYVCSRLSCLPDVKAKEGTKNIELVVDKVHDKIQYWITVPLNDKFYFFGSSEFPFETGSSVLYEWKKELAYHDYDHTDTPMPVYEYTYHEPIIDILMYIPPSADIQYYYNLIQRLIKLPAFK